jgi:hypothetical protein
VFLHIGDPRTGTTTLQSLLTKNRARLRKQNIHYPAVGLLAGGKGIAQHKLAFSLLQEWPKFAKKSEVPADVAWSELTKFMQALPEGEAALFISSEAFSSVKENGVRYVRDYFADDDVTPIFVRRDPDDWRRSMREQLAKKGQVVNEPKGPAKDIGIRKLARWQSEFDVRAVPYGEHCTRDVLAIANIDIGDLQPVERRNAQYSKDMLSLLDRLNRIPMTDANRHQFKQVLSDQFPGSHPRLMDLVDRARMDEDRRALFNENILRWASNKFG